MQVNIVVPFTVSGEKSPLIELANVAVNDDGTATLTLAEADDLQDKIYRALARARRIEDL